MKRLVIVAAALGSLVACGGGSEEPAKPKTFDVEGTMTLTTSRGVIAAGGGCAGSNGYEDMQAGANVVIFDSTGEKVGIGELEPGRSGSEPTVQCIFDFTVNDIPIKGDIYSVEVANRGEITFKRSEAKAVALTLG